MRLQKLNESQAQQSLHATGMNHIWIDSKNTGDPVAIIVYDHQKNPSGPSDYLVSKEFGEYTKINGAVSPDDKPKYTDIMWFFEK